MHEREHALDSDNHTGTISNAQHGTRSGGNLHSEATDSVSGFMSAVDKAKLNGIEAGADVTANHPPMNHASSHQPGGSDPMAVDAAPGIGSLRTLGTGANQACAGNDPRLSDSRPPAAHASSHETGGTDTLTHNNINGRSTHPAHPAHAIDNFITSVSFNVTLDATYRTVLIDTSSGDVTITLPAAMGTAGRIYEIKKISSDTNVVIIDGNGAETIDGATDFRLAGQNNGVTIQSDGTNWRVISQIFGNDYQSGISSARSTTTSSSPQDKLTLTTPALRGIYRVSWHAVVDTGQANRGTCARLYNVTDAAVVGVEQREWPQDTNELCQVGGYDLINFTGAAKTFKVQFRSYASGVTVGIQDARIELWRVS